MKRKRFFWISIVVVICLVSAVTYLKMQKGQTVETAVVGKGEIKQYVEDTAVVKSSNKQTIYIEGSGKITSIKVNVGDAVKKGDILLTLDNEDLELKLQDANAKIDAARAQLSGAENLNNTNKIEIAQAAADEAKVKYDAAARSFNNAKVLYSSGSISKEELNNTEDAFKTAELALKSAKFSLEDTKEGTPDYVKSQYSSQLQQAVIAKDAIVKEIEKQQVISTVDGVVLEKLVEEDSQGTAGTVAFVIGDAKALELEADILSDDVYKVKIGNEVEVRGKAIGDSVIKGRVIEIAPEARNIISSLGVNQKRVAVTIEIIGDTGMMKPGYDMDIKIITETRKDTLVIPDSAVFDYKGSASVFIVHNEKAVVRKIKKGLEGEKTVEVIEGLKPGDRILVKPDNNVTEGMKIKL